MQLHFISARAYNYGETQAQWSHIIYIWGYQHRQPVNELGSMVEYGAGKEDVCLKLALTFICLKINRFGRVFE